MTDSQRFTLDADRPRYTTKHLADALGVSQNFIRAQVAEGALHASVNRVWRGRRLLRFSLTDITAYDRDAAKRVERAA